MKTPKPPTAQVSWGIIRYAPGSGLMCDDDAAGFDGWYFDRTDALAVAEDWAREYPRWIVALVSSDLIWFSNENFYHPSDGPLTTREQWLHDGMPTQFPGDLP